MRQEQENLFAGCLNGTRRQWTASAAEGNYNLLGITSADVPFAEESLQPFCREFGCLAGRGRQLDQSPNLRLTGSSGELKHVRIVAMEWLTELATMALKAKVEFLVQTRQLPPANDDGISWTNRAEAMLISLQGIGQHECVASVILFTETIELLRTYRKDAQTALQ